MEKHLYTTQDVGLIHRALEAVYIYETARTFKTNQDLLNDSQWEIVVELNKAISPLAKRAPRVFKKA